MRTTVWLPAIALALLWCGIATAQSERDRRSFSSSSSSSQPQVQAQRQQPQQPRQHMLQGQLISYRTARLQGESEPHVLGKVRLESGRTVVVNLGPVSNLQRNNVQLRPNQRVQATGKPGRINGMPVLVIDRFVGDGRATAIAFIPESQRRRQTLQQAQASGSGAGGRTLVLASGRLTDVRDVDLRGLPESHRLARMQTRGGKDVIVDFGSQRSLGDIRLDRGERVTVIGSLGKVNGKPVLFASHVADLATIDRSGDQRAAQQQQQSSQQRQPSSGRSSSGFDTRR